MLETMNSERKWLICQFLSVWEEVDGEVQYLMKNFYLSEVIFTPRVRFKTNALLLDTFFPLRFLKERVRREGESFIMKFVTSGKVWSILVLVISKWYLIYELVIIEENNFFKVLNLKWNILLTVFSFFCPIFSTIAFVV